MIRWLILRLVLASAMAAGTLVVWLNRAEWLSDPLPVHWNAAGEVDQTVPLDGAFWWLMLVPLITFAFVGLVEVLPWLSPAAFQIAPFRTTYDFIMSVVIGMFVYMQAVVLAVQAGWEMDIGRWIVGGLMLFMLFLGNVLGKVRRNFWVGVRTPWTLASDLVWNQTHRVAAWLFVGGSLLGLVLVLVGVDPLIALVPFFVSVFAPVFYSLWYYKRLQREGRLEEQTPDASPTV